MAALGNANGIAIGFTQGGTVGATIGGLNPQDRNLISGNSNVGIIETSNFNGGSNSVIQGNIIGLDKNAASAVPNQWGILIGGGGPGTSMIGGLTPEAGNIISGNSTVGVTVGSLVSTVTIRGNSIFDNGALGIRLSNRSDLNLPLPNDADDADGGPNGSQNFPIVSSVEIAVRRDRLHADPGRSALAPFDDLRPRLLRELRLLPISPRVPRGPDLHRLGPGHDGRHRRRPVRRDAPGHGRGRGADHGHGDEPGRQHVRVLAAHPVLHDRRRPGPPAGGTSAQRHRAPTSSTARR